MWRGVENLADDFAEAYRQGYIDRDSEIVKCKDCKYWRTDENVRCRLLPYADANDFCSYGERIDNE